MRWIARISAFLSLVASSLFFFQVRSLPGVLLAIPKLVLPLFAPAIALLGILGAALGFLLKERRSFVAGALGMAAALRYLRRVSAPHDGFERAFGEQWAENLPPALASRMLARRWSWRLPPSPEPRLVRDLAFWTIPESGRRLLCDIWLPPEGVAPSGVAVVYLHGGGWHWLDKDYGTRPLFTHLAAQGHVVMDVAYRLCPETDFRGMVGDAKRAVVWMKRNAHRYGVDPARIVLAGGSAGGQLALLAAYAPDHPDLTPDDVKDSDRTVLGVVSYYGPADMHAVYESTALSLLARNDGEYTAARNGVMARKNRKRGRFAIARAELMCNLLGGLPDEVADRYALASPITHVDPECPPTLLFHGEHDFMVPVAAARRLYQALVAARVPVVYVEFPQTDHAFDLASMSANLGSLSQQSPPAIAALYDLDRFLALMAVYPVKPKRTGTPADGLESHAAPAGHRS